MSDLLDLVGDSILEDDTESNHGLSQPLTDAELIHLDSLLQRLNVSKHQIINQSKHADADAPDRSVKAKSIRKVIVDIARAIDATQLTLLGLNKEGFSRKQAIKKNQSIGHSKKSMKKAADRKHIESVNLRNARNAALQSMMEQHAHGNVSDVQLIEYQSQLTIEDQSTEESTTQLINQSPVDDHGVIESDSQSTSQPMLTDEAATTNHSSFHVRTIISPTDQSATAQLADQSVIKSNNQSVTVSDKSTDKPVNKRKNKIDQAGQFVDPPKSEVTIDDEDQSADHSTDKSTNQSTDQSIDDNADFGPELSFPRSCYSCKARFFRLHRFYDQFCADCARLNWSKRKQLADLTGWVIMLTGCRVKIGYCIGLRILRSGGRLIGTSRFPVDTVRRYLAEKDSNVWSDRLHIYGLDMRDLQATHQFCSMVIEKHPRIDALINNAAQTVRRPVAYYRHLMPVESINRSSMPAEWKQIVQFDDSHSSRIAAIQAKTEIPSENNDAPLDQSVSQSANQSVTPAAQVPHSTSALLSQLALTVEDQQSLTQSHFFPAGKFDVTGQQLDLRPINSWILTLDQVSPVELVEVFAINALSPFILCAGLRKALANRPQNIPSSNQSIKSNVPHYSHIVNVSAMEGKFYRHKSPFHPHTNMAKAALNMMTRTSAQDYAQQRIWMNAADTGWINDENTFEKAKEIREVNNFQTPIDEEDAAARILDPIMQSAIHGVHHFGKFFKDYRETEW